MNRLNRFLTTALLAAMPLAGACDAGELMPPEAVDGMFMRYVSIGNSIAAGFQSLGISETTQLESYPALLAERMGLTVGGHNAEFNIPLMLAPGCPPPYINIFTRDRGPGLSDSTCVLRKTPVATYLSNVAVPGAAVLDAITNLEASSNPNGLTTLFLGGRTQLEAAADVEPTFVTVWMGGNDALGAITTIGDAGNPSHVTDPTVFASQYSSMMDTLDAMTSIEGGVLLGVVQVGLAPYLTQGRVWAGFELQFDAMVHAELDAAFQALTGGASLPFTANIFDVNVNCPLDFQAIPGTSDTAWASVPFHYGAPIFGSAGVRASDPAVVDSIFNVALGNPAYTLPVPDSIDCSHQDAVTSTEMLNLMSSISAFNAAIEQEAADRDTWIYVDPNVLLGQLAADTTAIRPFPAFPGTVADPSITLNSPFGTALSLDGFHPSSSSHVLVANALVAAINAAFGTSIPDSN